MVDLFKLLLGQNSPPAADPVQTDAARIRDQIAQWQAQWHDLFDSDQTLIALGEFGRPDPVPSDYGCDFRLIFGLCRAQIDTRTACFAMLPEGAAMAARLDDYLTEPPVPLPEDAARQKFADLAQLIQAAGPNEDVDFTAITIIDRDTPEGLARLKKTDNITVLLEGTPMDPYQDRAPLETAAHVFLSEPLYATAGNYYHLGDWVTSAMDSAEAQAMQASLFALWRGGWQVAFDQDGVILAKRHVGPRP